jgi:hypothetical protein
MHALLAPFAMGVSAARHLAWYVNYQVTGETRPVAVPAEAVSEAPAA